MVGAAFRGGVYLANGIGVADVGLHPQCEEGGVGFV
jgi:hypothetical protein